VFDADVTARRVRDLRVEMGINQDDLADNAGVRRGYISNLERGKISNPQLDNIIAIAEALNTSPSYILGWDDNPGYVVEGMEDLPEAIQTVVQMAARLNPDKQRELLFLTRALLAAQDEELERLRQDIKTQAALLRALYQQGGEEMLMEFFSLVGLPTGEAIDIDTLRIRYGV
jgi:transcriptional regulator with XRE-family HTH domain